MIAIHIYRGEVLHSDAYSQRSNTSTVFTHYRYTKITRISVRDRSDLSFLTYANRELHRYDARPVWQPTVTVRGFVGDRAAATDSKYP
jgi:hypothetical protein